jgi:MFS family permease
MALVQFFFVTTWTIYVIFLPTLLKGAGISASWVPYILLVDQLVFMAMDIYVGVAADRTQKMLGNLGPLMMAMTAVSCVAFLLLPFAACAYNLGPAVAPAVVLGLTLMWTATSSALRAPPWVLLSKYAAQPSLPALNTLMLMGLALGGAVAPYLGVTLKNIDPRWPFVLSSVSLLLATAGIIFVERRLKLRPLAPVSPTPEPADVAGRSWPFLAGALLLALGFQIHVSINASVQYLRFAKPGDLEWLLPVFWVGFGVAMMPGGALSKRFGEYAVMTVAAFLGAAGACVSAAAGSLEMLIDAQAVTGGAWGCMLMCGFTAATSAGRSGREGLSLGLLFAMLAAAAVSRIIAVLAGLPKHPQYASVLEWAPVLCWAGGALLLGAIAVGKCRPAN